MIQNKYMHKTTRAQLNEENEVNTGAQAEPNTLSRAWLVPGGQTLIQSALLREKRGMRVLMQEKSFGFESRNNRE